jgi:hypothetical protein
MEILIIYWIVTTIFGVYWLIKNPSRFESKDEFSLADILGNILPSMIIAPFILPLYLLSLIKFKRK